MSVSRGIGQHCPSSFKLHLLSRECPMPAMEQCSRSSLVTTTCHPLQALQPANGHGAALQVLALLGVATTCWAQYLRLSWMGQENQRQG